MGRWLVALKRLLVGRPISSHAEIHHRLPKRLALPVFASDALSSSAYATDEILLVLILAGAAALHLSVPIAMAVVLVLIVVVVSYQQTVRAYPSGGGAYIVAHDNLGEMPGLIAGSSLLIDYVLTVAVSVAAGVKALGAAYPTVWSHRVGVALAVVAIITLANLRGLKESGTLFAVPTYGFLISMGVMIVVGSVKVVTGNFHPSPVVQVAAVRPLTLFVVLWAFASGSTALTGVEAISNGIPAFRPPESRNAGRTLLVLGVLLTFLFAGITFLANAFHVDPLALEKGKTVASQIAGSVFGKGSLMFVAVQAFTALILFLAANTSYADFPRLSSILAKDRYLPRVFQNRGDKLAFSNGILILAAAAGGLLVGYDSDPHRIIPLYVIGVFTSFTLSQSGMFVRWRRLRSPGWRVRAAVNGFGAGTTLIVLIVVTATKFRLGAWQVIVLIPAIAFMLRKIGRHYRFVAAGLREGRDVPKIKTNRVVVLLSPVIGANLKALSFARAFGPNELRLLGFRIGERDLAAIRKRWKNLGIDYPIEATGPTTADLVDFVRGFEPDEEDPVTVVIPDPQFRSPVEQLLKGRGLLRIKGAFLSEPGVVVVSVPYRIDEEHEPDRLRSPTKLSVIVVVSAVHRATLRALEYARSLQPAELKALTVALDPAEGQRLISDWLEWGVEAPLEVIDSPYRSIMQPLVRQVRALRSHPEDAVVVVVPEFVVPHWWQQLLHGQTALMVKSSLLFEPNVIVVDVPSPIQRPGASNESGEQPPHEGDVAAEAETDAPRSAPVSR